MMVDGDVVDVVFGEMEGVVKVFGYCVQYCQGGSGDFWINVVIWQYDNFSVYVYFCNV